MMSLTLPEKGNNILIINFLEEVYFTFINCVVGERQELTSAVLEDRR